MCLTDVSAGRGLPHERALGALSEHGELKSAFLFLRFQGKEAGGALEPAPGLLAGPRSVGAAVATASFLPRGFWDAC